MSRIRKWLHFSAKDMVQLFESVRILDRRMIPFDRNTRVGGRRHALMDFAAADRGPMISRNLPSGRTVGPLGFNRGTYAH
jgi:hypothetical protein